MTEQTITALCPFDDPSADVILYSTQSEMDFHVHRVVLSLASPFFKDMFSFPKPVTGADETKNGLPIIPVSEGAEVLGDLLRLCYPIEEPRLETLEDMRRVLEAAKKYQMAAVMTRIERVMNVRFSDKDPMRVFAIACCYELEATARTAARQILRQPLHRTPRIPEMAYITAEAYHMLLEYYWKCQEVYIAAVVDKCSAWLPHRDWVWFQCKSCSSVRRFWWDEHLARLLATLKDGSPCEATVTSPDIMNPTFERGSECAYCRPRIFREMAMFNELLIAEITKNISDVKLQLTF